MTIQDRDWLTGLFIVHADGDLLEPAPRLLRHELLNVLVMHRNQLFVADQRHVVRVAEHRPVQVWRILISRLYSTASERAAVLIFDVTSSLSEFFEQFDNATLWEEPLKAFADFAKLGKAEHVAVVEEENHLHVLCYSLLLGIPVSTGHF